MKKILVVDDAPAIGILMEDVLGPYGFEVDTAPNADAAMERIRKATPDLVLLDVMMPGKDGFDFLAELKQTAFRQLPVIMLTVKNDRSDIEKGRKLGAADYITKPFDPEDVVARIKNILEKKD